MIGRDFRYDNIWLSQFGMSMYTPEEAQKFAPREVIKSNLSPIKSEAKYYTTQYSDTLSLYFLILKNDELCKDQSDRYLKEDELNSLRTWLEGVDECSELYLDSDNNQNNTYYYGVFTDVQPYLLNDECYGLSLTFTCNAPYGFSPLFTETIYPQGVDGEYTISFNNRSSEKHKMLSPVISIRSTDVFTGNELIVVTNTSIEKCRPITFTPPLGKALIVVDCTKKTVEDENRRSISLRDLGLSFSKTDSYLSTEHMTIPWVKLKSGENQLSINITGASTVDNVQISARFPVKSGGF